MRSKHIFLIFALLTYISSHAYEVYKDGKEINKNAVMKAVGADIGNLSIQFEEELDFELLMFYNRERPHLFAGRFLTKDAIAIIKPVSILILGKSHDYKPDYDVSLKIDYELVNGKKLYKIHFNDISHDRDVTHEGIPTFNKFILDDNPCIGTETNEGRIPVLLEWLEHWLKKKKIKIVYE